MALISCPDCGKPVSDAATTCGGCGLPIAGHYVHPASRQRWYHSSWAVGGALLFLYPIGVVLLWTSKGTKPLVKVLATLVMLPLFIAVVSSSDKHPSTATATGAVGDDSQQSKLYGILHPNERAADNAEAVPIGTLLGAYRANEVRADEAYKDRWITTAGIVASIGKDITDSAYVAVGTGQEFEIPQVQCFVTDDQLRNAARASKGSRITVTGRVSGLMMNIIVRDCRIE